MTSALPHKRTKTETGTLLSVATRALRWANPDRCSYISKTLSRLWRLGILGDDRLPATQTFTGELGQGTENYPNAVFSSGCRAPLQNFERAVFVRIYQQGMS